MHLGIDIGGTNIKDGILDDNSYCIETDSMQTNSHLGVENVVSRIKAVIYYYKKNMMFLQ